MDHIKKGIKFVPQIFDKFKHMEISEEDKIKL